MIAEFVAQVSPSALHLGRSSRLTHNVSNSASDTSALSGTTSGRATGKYTLT